MRPALLLDVPVADGGRHRGPDGDTVLKRQPFRAALNLAHSIAIDPDDHDRFVMHLADRTTVIEVWDADAHLLIGSARLPLRSTLRQRQPSIELRATLPVENENDDDDGNKVRGRIGVTVRHFGISSDPDPTYLQSHIVSAHPARGGALPDPADCTGRSTLSPPAHCVFTTTRTTARRCRRADGQHQRGQVGAPPAPRGEARRPGRSPGGIGMGAQARAAHQGSGACVSAHAPPPALASGGANAPIDCRRVGRPSRPSRRPARQAAPPEADRMRRRAPMTNVSPAV